MTRQTVTYLPESGFLRLAGAHPYSGIMPASRAVVLFDIDGTLLSRAGPHHKQALVQAIQEVTGIDTSFGDMPTSGQA